MKRFCYFPYENFVFYSPLSPYELAGELRKALQSSNEFKAKVGINGFTIRKKVSTNTQNSFLPFVEGEFKKDISKSKIKVEIRMNETTYAIIAMWYIIYFFIFFSLLFSKPWKYGYFKDALIMLIIVFGLGVFPYLLAVIVYNLEVRSVKKLLKKIFEI